MSGSGSGGEEETRAERSPDLTSAAGDHEAAVTADVEGDHDTDVDHDDDPDTDVDHDGDPVESTLAPVRLIRPDLDGPTPDDTEDPSDEASSPVLEPPVELPEPPPAPPSRPVIQRTLVAARIVSNPFDRDGASRRSESSDRLVADTDHPESPMPSPPRLRALGDEVSTDESTTGEVNPEPALVGELLNPGDPLNWEGVGIDIGVDEFADADAEFSGDLAGSPVVSPQSSRRRFRGPEPVFEAASRYMERVLRDPLPGLVVLAAMVLFSMVFSWAHIQSHRAFATYSFDTGIYDQAVWALGHEGNPFMTVRGLYVHGHHVNLILYLLVPVSWLGGGASSFLVIQTLVFALGAWPVYLIARKVLARPTPIVSRRPGCG